MIKSPIMRAKIDIYYAEFLRKLYGWYSSNSIIEKFSLLVTSV